MLGELTGCLVERDGATVVAETLPGADHVCPRGCGELAWGGPTLEPRSPAFDYAIDLCLLEHHLADEDRVRVARVSPGQIASVRFVPRKDTIGELLGRQRHSGSVVRAGLGTIRVHLWTKWTKIRAIVTDIVNVHEAKTHLSKLLARVEAGEEIILARGGTPIAKIVPIPVKREWAGPGAWKGKYDIPDDAFEWSEAELEEMFNNPVFPNHPDWEDWVRGRGPKPE